MKRFFPILLILIILIAFCSCNSISSNSSDSATQNADEPYSDIENKLIGSWESQYAGHTTITIFESGGKGRSITDTGNTFEFTYSIINDHQIENTMTTIEGVERTAVYEFELTETTLIFDGVEYIKK